MGDVCRWLLSGRLVSDGLVHAGCVERVRGLLAGFLTLDKGFSGLSLSKWRTEMKDGRYKHPKCSDLVIGLHPILDGRYLLYRDIARGPFRVLLSPTEYNVQSMPGI